MKCIAKRQHETVTVHTFDTGVFLSDSSYMVDVWRQGRIQNFNVAGTAEVAAALMGVGRAKGYPLPKLGGS